MTGTITGTGCAHCKAAVEEPGRLSGVGYANADPDGGTVEARYDEGRVTSDDLAGAVEGAGHAVTA